MDIEVQPSAIGPNWCHNMSVAVENTIVELNNIMTIHFVPRLLIIVSINPNFTNFQPLFHKDNSVNLKTTEVW